MNGATSDEDMHRGYLLTLKLCLAPLDHIYHSKCPTSAVALPNRRDPLLKLGHTVRQSRQIELKGITRWLQSDIRC